MDYTMFTPYKGLIGGFLIGLSAVLLMWLNGRIAGVSGMVHGLCPPGKKTEYWRIAFILGLLVGGLSFQMFPAIQFSLRTHYPVMILLLGGFCVGFGTRMGHGCTAGHGICGIARLSARSIVATLTFFISAVITTIVFRHIIGVY
ncbi:transporter component [Legionella londiniensis]|uniref:Transporter protein n=2 Tax=Legionella londiniensis TaxID=45068 RepID=A0A0W0VQG9_9GAMM|nr:transporter protein [Legionella londiniensis]STX93062.1 transporter component [Legionella londiniensis]